MQEASKRCERLQATTLSCIDLPWCAPLKAPLVNMSADFLQPVFPCKGAGRDSGEALNDARQALNDATALYKGCDDGLSCASPSDIPTQRSNNNSVLLCDRQSRVEAAHAHNACTCARP